MFYYYNQNNSGGSFDFDESAGITHNVIIEASNVGEANDRAEEIGLYWDGCDKGMDCPCCGDRWYQPYSDDGDEKPMLCGTEVGGEEKGNPMKWMDKGKETAVHYADKSIKWFA